MFFKQNYTSCKKKINVNCGRASLKNKSTASCFQSLYQLQMVKIYKHNYKMRKLSELGKRLKNCAILKNM